MGKSHTDVLPLLPLPYGSVLLPGVIQRLVVATSRSDISALLGKVYTRAASKNSGRIDTFRVSCVPYASHLISPSGQLLIEQGDRSEQASERDYSDTSTLTKADLFGYGTAAKIMGVEGKGTGELTLLVEGVARVRVDKVYHDDKSLEGKVQYCQDQLPPVDAAFEERFRHLQVSSRELVATLRLLAILPRSGGGMGFSPPLARRLDSFIVKTKVHQAGVLADMMASIVQAGFEQKLEILSLLDVGARMAKVMELLDLQVGKIKSSVKITTFGTTSPRHSDPDATQQEIENFWRPNNKQQVPPRSTTTAPFPPPATFMKSGGGPRQDDDRESSDIDELEKKLDSAKLSPEAAKVAERELSRLRKMVPAQAEYMVVRNYLEILAEIPWTSTEGDHLDSNALSRARAQLDDDHYGLDKVKRRILEYLAVLRLKQSINDDIDTQIKQAESDVALTGSDGSSEPRTSADITLLKSKRLVDKAPILLFIGPPGVGKTSLARSIASALGRKFHRISLGGVRDEAEIRGHRLTYVAARPGLIVQGLRKVGVSSPVFLLDEIDKLGGSNFHGDPSAAMLEVLDPEQNFTFTDHYVNVPLDLSKVLFIATANSLDTIPPPLLDRMEMIEIPAYTTLMKKEIASRHLMAKQIRVNGLNHDQVVMGDDVVSKIIRSYTREAGVRNLEREIGSVCRAKAVEFAEAKDAGHVEKYTPLVTVEDMERILGTERFEEEIAEKTSQPGIVTGLVAYSSGGDGSIFVVEVCQMPGGSGSVQLTGKLGDVLRESCEVALSWVKSNAYHLQLTGTPEDNILSNRSIHVHCLPGAIPKDGPSSGLAQVIALISLFSGKAVRPTIAMTGEITLRGRVTAVGGIREKLVGALRAGVKTVLIPHQNRKDIRDLDQEVRDGLDIVHVRYIWEAIRHVWPDSYWPGEKGSLGLETLQSRL